MEAPERAILVSYIIKNMNRDACAKVDRLLKGDYKETRVNPLMTDIILRCQFMSFFSDTGVGDLTRDLVKYYREKEMYSTLLDAKNMLVVSSKENIVNASELLDPKFLLISKSLIEKGRDKIIKGHIKSSVASCILMGKLGEKFSELMSGNVGRDSSDTEFIEFVKETCKECKDEIDELIEGTNKVTDTNKTYNEDN